VASARQGREEAYRELLRRYRRPVHTLIYRMVRDPDVAEDLTQDTFVEVLQALDRYRPECRFSSWILEIANNTTIDHLRRRRPEMLALDGSRDVASIPAAERTESTPAKADPGDLRPAIEQAIGRLREKHRTCIILRHLEGRSYEDIAEILDLPLGTVKSLIHRARRELREMLRSLRDTAQSPSPGSWSRTVLAR